MTGLKKSAAILVYLFLLSALLEFKLQSLFDIKQFLLVLLGAGAMSLAFVDWKEKDRKTEAGEVLSRFGACALWASFLETFILWILAMRSAAGLEAFLAEMALCLRPVFYGFCLWSIFSEESFWGGGKKAGGKTEYRPAEFSASESYGIFQEMGLTRRETEIAILICQGKSNGEIAEGFCISEATVKKHVSNIFEKLDISRREQIRSKLYEHISIDE